MMIIFHRLMWPRSKAFDYFDGAGEHGRHGAGCRLCCRQDRSGAAGGHYAVGGLIIATVPAYNVGKDFHPKAQRFVGYIAQMNGLRYYIAGDTDSNEDVEKVRCDVALLPVGGTYTMTAQEAAELARKLQPQAAVPIHYGAIVGEKADGQRFCQQLPQSHSRRTDGALCQ